MAKVMTLSGASEEPRPSECKCVFNTRTKKWARLCRVPKTKKNRSGWAFQEGGSQSCSK